jgi:pyrroline-5-carboxylate reductase
MKAAAAGGAKIGFTDTIEEKAKAAAASLGAALREAPRATVLKSNIEAARKADYVFLAVKPQVLHEVLVEISPVVRQRADGSSAAVNDQAPVLVSMAAGWSIEKIQSTIGMKTPIIRIMPNTPALIGRGMIVMAASPETHEDKIAGLKNILESAGIVDCLEERLIDAATGLSGSGPAFVFLFIEALADGGVRAGLPRDKALLYAAQTVLGSAAMVRETGKHPGELKDMVCTPGGTTIAGIAALEDSAFRGAVIRAVEAAWRRSTELGL